MADATATLLPPTKTAWLGEYLGIYLLSYSNR